MSAFSGLLLFYACLRGISVFLGASHPHLCRAEVATSRPGGEGVDMLRKSPPGVFAKALGDRVCGIRGAVHVGLRLPLVFSLVGCVSLDTSGARVLRSREQVREGEDDAPVAWDSKLDKFDKRAEIVLNQQGKPGAVQLDEVEHTSL